MEFKPLSTDYKDEILSDVNLKRKYRQIVNEDGTISFQDMTAYEQEGSAYSAKDINEERKAINNIYANKVVSLEEASLVTEPGFFCDALVVNELNKNIPNIKAGSIIKTVAAKNDSVAVFTDDDINKMFGTFGSTNENTAVVFSDADSNATQSIHLDGTSYLSNKWYATYSKTFSGSTSVRINYIIVRA